MRDKSPLQKGFTLIELLVVILIIGLAVGIVSMNVGSSTDLMKLRNELRDFINHSSIVMEESIMSGKTLGVDLYTDMDNDGNQRYGYRWLTLLDDKTWQPIDVKDLPSENFFSVGVEAKLNIENSESETDIGAKVNVVPKKIQNNNTLNTESNNQSSNSQQSVLAEPIKPEIFISSSGEITPFIIELVLEDQETASQLSVKAKGDLLGRMKLVEGDDEQE